MVVVFHKGSIEKVAFSIYRLDVAFMFSLVKVDKALCLEFSNFTKLFQIMGM